MFSMSTDGDVLNSKFATKSYFGHALKVSNGSQQIISSDWRRKKIRNDSVLYWHF